LFKDTQSLLFFGYGLMHQLGISVGMGTLAMGVGGADICKKFLLTEPTRVYLLLLLLLLLLLIRGAISFCI
jgi:hypothetical protein